jgi:hypothetical protein
MNPHNKTAATTGIVDGGVVKNVVATSSYQIRPEIATSESYPVAKIQSRFRLRIETARLVCHLAGMGGASR